MYIYEEMVDFGESGKMINISGKVDKSNTFNRFTGFVLYLKNFFRQLNKFCE